MVSSAGDGGRWLQLHAAQGAHRSERFAVHLVDARVLEGCICKLRRKMSRAEQAELEASGERASAPLAAAARRCAKLLLDRLPTVSSTRSLLIIVGIEGIQRRIGRRGDAASEPLPLYAMSLAHACVAALLLDAGGWRVHLAATDAKAIELVGIIAEVCEREALLGRKQ